MNLPFEVPEEAPANVRPQLPMAEVIIAVLEARDREFRTQEIAELLAANYGWKMSSVRSLLGKMAKLDEIVLVRRGVYRSVKP